MKKSFATLVAVLATLCTTSTALAETPATAPEATVSVTVLNTPQLHYSVTRTGETRPKITKLPHDGVFNIGEDIKIQFAFTGTPVPEVTVYRDGKKITNSDKYRLTCEKKEGVYNFTLLIIEVAPEDMGTYQFKIQNEYGEDSVSVILRIID